MFDPFTVGKKASKFGYRKFGIPGAVVIGAVAVAGYFVARKKVKSALKGDASDADAEGTVDEKPEQRSD